MIDVTRSICAYLAILFALALSGCGGPSAQSGTAEEFVKYYFDCVNAGDVDAMYAVQVPQNIKELGEAEIRKDMQFNVDKYRRDGGIKSLDFTYSVAKPNLVRFEGTMTMSSGKQYTTVGSVQKIDGKWYKS